MLPQEKCRTTANLAQHLQPVEFFTVIDRPVKKSGTPISLNLRYERDSSTDRIERGGEEPVGSRETGAELELLLNRSWYYSKESVLVGIIRPTDTDPG